MLWLVLLVLSVSMTDVDTQFNRFQQPQQQQQMILVIKIIVLKDTNNIFVVP